MFKTKSVIGGRFNYQSRNMGNMGSVQEHCQAAT
jgi:hypothetical protein